MKNIIILIFCVCSLLSVAQETTNIIQTTAIVNGNCGMCKKTIEKALSQEKSAHGEWNKDSKILTFTFDKNETSPKKILQQIANAGYDNEMFLADDKTYQSLPDCCHYDRSIDFNALTKSHENHSSEISQKSITVKGNCEMCKKRIENAVANIPSAKGIWDVNTKILTVSFDNSKTDFQEIMKEVARNGHDNELFLAKDKDYENLATCCLYDREISFEDYKKMHQQSTEKGADKNPNHHQKEMQHGIELSTTIVQANDAATKLDAKSIGLTFKIDEKELLKAACCNLSESFETNATVDVNYANAVSGTKQIKMLGLDQKYILFTKELLPDVRGLATAYGLNLIPGRWINGIQLTKGGSSVSYGYESISGQINTELFKGEKPKTSFNFFADLNSRIESNLVHVDKINDKWNQSYLVHGNATLNKIDRNEDGFLDQPTGNQLNFAYLINYNDLENSGWGTHFGINYAKDIRNGGQTGFDRNINPLQQKFYGLKVDLNRFQVWNKTGYVFKDKPYQSIGLMNQITLHNQNSFFGNTIYNGEQKTFYTNLIFESILGNTAHQYKLGGSFLYDDFDEDYLQQNFLRTEYVPGLFAEYTYIGDKITAVAGTRIDFHNHAGTQISPRLNIKYDILPKTTVRFNAGKGFRTANIFTESQAYFASNRKVEIFNNQGEIYGLQPEEAWNFGASIHQEFRAFGRKSNIVADYYQTHFSNQVIPDLDASTHKILFYNMNGDSYAKAFQIQWDLEPLPRLETRLAYKNYQTKAQYISGENTLPFTPEHRGFLNLAYSTFKNVKKQQWTFDTTLQWVGKQRIPTTQENSEAYQLPEMGEAYFLWSAQMARQFNEEIRIYLGFENILSYTQDNPIVDVENPFSNYFDGGMVYAPIMPINAYIGLDIEF